LAKWRDVSDSLDIPLARLVRFFKIRSAAKTRSPTPDNSITGGGDPLSIQKLGPEILLVTQREINP
jgi:hypothetical protein